MKRVKRLESGDSVRVAYPLFYQLEGGGSIPTSPLQFDVVKISGDKAVLLNELWHSRLPQFGGIPRICYANLYDGLYYAVAIWSSPIARMLPQGEWMELRRMAISPDSPKNTASRMLRIMSGLISQTFPEVKKLISYQDMAVHNGTIYKASGWYATRIDKRERPGDWNYPSRYAAPPQATGYKQRWEYDLRNRVEG